MVLLRRRALGLALLGLALALDACSKPEPPRVVPRAVRVGTITPSEVRLIIELEVYNPNSFPLLVQSARGKLEVANGLELGTGQAMVGGNVPAKSSSIVSADVGLSWTNIPALTPLALSAASVPYTFRGSAVVGGERLNVEVPFTLTGELTRAQLIQAGLRGLSAIPGLQGGAAAPPP